MRSAQFLQEAVTTNHEYRVAKARIGQCLINQLRSDSEDPAVRAMAEYYTHNLLGTDKDFFHWECTPSVLEQFDEIWRPILDAKY